MKSSKKTSEASPSTTVASLIEAGVEIVTNRYLERVAADHAVSKCVFSGQEMAHAVDWVLPLTRREPKDDLYRELAAGPSGMELRRIGDCEAPGLIAAAVYSGHKAAMELGVE